MAQSEYFESEPQPVGGGNNQSTERSIKSCYAVVYELENRKWVVAGEGGWSEVHLCEDTLDNSHRILAWTVKSQQVLMNCNVTSDCQYKEKSKNFHSFSDENGNRYGLGFHKSESGLKQASQFLKAVISVITLYKENTKVIAQPPPPPPPNNTQKSINAPDLYSQSSKSSTMPPPHQYKNIQNNTSTNNNDNSYEQGKNQPPPMFSQVNDNKKDANGYNNDNANDNANPNGSKVEIKAKPPSPPPQAQGLPKKYQHSPSPEAKSNQTVALNSGMRPGDFQPTYHLNKEQHKSVPTAEISGFLKILPPKQRKHFSGDKKIKNPSSVEHKVRVTHDKETGLYVGLPPEWLDHLNKQFGVNPKQLPCISLPQYESKIPNVLIRLRNALEEANGYNQVGIFRLAPNASINNKIKAKIDKGQLDDAQQEEKIDVNVYANLIKVWFRDLPDPLLNCVNPDLIEHVSNIDDAQNVIQSFPEPNKSIFLWLCDMCVEIAKSRKTNKMGPQNMAIVVGPNLFNTDKFENPMKAMTYSGKVVEFFKHSILWREKMLG